MLIDNMDREPPIPLPKKLTRARVPSASIMSLEIKVSYPYIVTRLSLCRGLRKVHVLHIETCPMLQDGILRLFTMNFCL